MDNNARLKALSRLAQSKTEAAEAALRDELEDAIATLDAETNYDALSQSLEILDVIGYRFSNRTVDFIGNFVQTIEGRELTYAESFEDFPEYIAEYNNTQSLIAKAVEVIVRLRYLETKPVLRILLSLHDHPSEKVRQKAYSGLDSLAKYDLNVFYGADRKGGIGPAPQNEILEELEPMNDPSLKANFEASQRILSNILSPTLEGISWSYNAATFSHGAIPAIPLVADVRARSIKMLCRIYSLANTTKEKLAVISALTESARTEHRVAMDEKTQEMVSRDSVEVLNFFAQLIQVENFRIVQKIESESYWIFVRAFNDDIRNAALKVEEAITENNEYADYRTLIGFEGIFGDWATYERTGERHSAIEKERREKASELAHSITADNYSEWRTKILEYAKTESDDLATFPVFYHFLSEFAGTQPDLALRLISEDTSEVARFLIPILSSLWNSAHRNQARALIERWIDERGSDQDLYLFSAIKMFLSTRELDIDLLKRLLSKVAALQDISCVRQVTVVAIAHWEEARDVILTELLYPSLDVQTEMKSASWINEIWFRDEARKLFAGMNPEGVEHILQNLLVLNKIDYHAEEVLSSLAQQTPERVIQFFVRRIEKEEENRINEGTRDFDSIPFEFYKLQEPLSKIPGAAVSLVLEHYRKDATLFEFRGARLLKNIFPKFSEEFEAELLRLIREGIESNLEFVVKVLRNYEGKPFIHRLCKAIVKTVESDSPILAEVAIALETTGVVAGEFGMAEAYESKRQEVLDWLTDSDEKVKIFAERYVENLQRMLDAETQRAEEEIALRKHRYGED
ncbi:MAG: hypothetical protein ABW090_11835 [Sedimenticola sp.]